MTIKESLLSDKNKLYGAVDQRDRELRELALNIHANPELAYEEYKAVEWITHYLEEEGFHVERGVAGLETAFTAEWEGTSVGPTIAFLAEYDALPKLGHACGHNIIAASAVGAAISLKDAFPNLPGVRLKSSVRRQKKVAAVKFTCVNAVYLITWMPRCCVTR